ncbi:MAG: polysaccharide deacetylase family protein [Treponema sp.]|nr:polysaccharide deacetylase family protein [Treponema sp.]
MFFLLSLSPAWGKINFSGLDLSRDNRLLFRAASSGSGVVTQDSLFVSSLSDLSIVQLSAFPEKLDLLESGRTLQVRNAFGVFRLPVSGGLPRPIPGFVSFAGGAPVLGGRAEELEASPDGRWVLAIDPVSPAYGNLVMIDTQSGEKVLVASRVERPEKIFPACWSPDSRGFVYAKGNELYYYTANSAAIQVNDKFRLIGEGTLNSVYWGQGGDFFYIRGSTVYRVRGSELFARALYADFLEIGAIAGKIPFEFDPVFDSFWIAPDAGSVMLAKDGRNIFYYPLGFDDYDISSDNSLPYLAVPRSCYNLNLLWSPGGAVTILASVTGAAAEAAVMAWRLDAARASAGFQAVTVSSGFGASLSPDGTRALIWGQEGAVLYDYTNWRILETLSRRPVYACLWAGLNEFIIGDGSRIERVVLEGERAGRRDIICLSSAEEFAFEDQTPPGGGARILAKNNGVWFVTDEKSPWVPVSAPVPKAASQLSSRYRVYLESQNSGPYENLPMIRNILSVGTTALLPKADYQGLRAGRQEISLCFDLYDNAEGLPWVLEALDRFGAKATFFLNGEFIRRHPGAARDIAAAGHEAASMFFAPLDLSDSRYNITEDFIARGLARNEDEFFQAAGAELGLLWHAPYYVHSSDITAAATHAGYTTVTRDFDPLDWINKEEAQRLGLVQPPASEIVDHIIEAKKPLSVIPIRLGLLNGGRKDYLFSRINVLLDALTREGWSIIPVSALMERRR